MRGTGRPPPPNMPLDPAQVAVTGLDDALKADSGRITSRGRGGGPNLLEPFFEAASGDRLWNPAVGNGPNPPCRPVRHSRPDPDGDGSLSRKRGDADADEGVVSPVDVHDVVGPEPAQDLDLFLEDRTAPRKTAAHRLEFDTIPPGADPESQPAAAEDVEGSSGFCDGDGLSLGQDDHPGQKSDVEAASDVAVQDEEFVEGIGVRIRLTETVAGKGPSGRKLRMALWRDPEIVIAGGDVCDTGVGHHANEIVDGLAAAGGQLCLGKDDADLQWP